MFAFQLCSTAHAHLGAVASCTCTLGRHCPVRMRTSMPIPHVRARFAAACVAWTSRLCCTMFTRTGSLEKKSLEEQWHMPNTCKEIYADVGYGHSPNNDGKAVHFWCIRADGVDQAKFRVPCALTKSSNTCARGFVRRVCLSLSCGRC